MFWGFHETIHLWSYSILANSAVLQYFILDNTSTFVTPASHVGNYRYFATFLCITGTSNLQMAIWVREFVLIYFHMREDGIQPWRLSHSMMTWSTGNIFRVTGPLCGEFTGHRWISRTKASDAEFWCFLWSAPWKKRLGKQSWGWWIETPSRS